MIQSVTSLDGQIVFDEISWKEKKYAASNKYTSKKPDYFIRGDGYLFVTVNNEDIPEVLFIEGLFEDPVEAYEFPSLCDEEGEEDCTDIKDLDFPLDGDQLDTAIEMCAKELVEALLKIPEDKTNDMRDSPEELSR